MHPRTSFLVVDEDVTLPFALRDENLKGVLFTTRALREPHTYRMKVRALSYSEDGGIEYQTTFIVYIAVSAYPYWEHFKWHETKVRWWLCVLHMWHHWDRRVSRCRFWKCCHISKKYWEKKTLCWVWERPVSAHSPEDTRKQTQSGKRPLEVNRRLGWNWLFIGLNPWNPRVSLSGQFNWNVLIFCFVIFPWPLQIYLWDQQDCAPESQSINLWLRK